MIEARRLTLEQMREIYEKELVYDFPEDEVKPFQAIEAMYEQNVYFAYGFYHENGELTAYAMFVRAGEVCLLDYLAVTRACGRGNGMGSQVMSKIRELLVTEGIETMYLESEHPDSACSEEDREIRNRRLAFYKRNGMLITSVETELFGVHYHILKSAENSRQSDWESLLQIYHIMFSEKIFKDHIKMWANSLS